MNKNLMFAAAAALALPLISCQEEMEGVRTGMVDYSSAYTFHIFLTR